MPFDNTTGLTESAPDLSKPSLEALSWLLRHREAWPKGHVWDYSHGRSCALGMCVGQWPAAVPFVSYDRVSAALGVGRDDIDRTFGQSAYMPIKDILVTPEMVAYRIDTRLRSLR